MSEVRSVEDVTLALHCYCCGEPLGAVFALVSEDGGSVDRVLLMKQGHAKAAGHAAVDVERTL